MWYHCVGLRQQVVVVFFAGMCDDCILQYMNVQCVYAGAAVVYLYKCLGVCSFVPVADMSTLVKSQKLQAVAFFEKERVWSSQSAVVYETRAWPDVASLQSLRRCLCCLVHHILALCPVWKYPSALMDISFNNQWLITAGNRV